MDIKGHSGIYQFLLILHKFVSHLFDEYQNGRSVSRAEYHRNMQKSIPLKLNS